MTEHYEVPEIFHTERYEVRRVRSSDADGIFHSYASDSDVTRFLTWRPATSPDQTRANIEVSRADWDAGKRFASVITPKNSSSEIMGMIDARVSAGSRTVTSCSAVLGGVAA
ncbi:GNAT family N-acetyltransferase [Bosea sp. 2RAB26]|uniref:GNAT family N-acetyltransferase n=1 Tax=Bosea sp. 2RAB26 TaxID=3237476 RepID=UPI003F909FE4